MEGLSGEQWRSILAEPVDRIVFDTHGENSAAR